MSQKARLLLVDDDPPLLQLLTQLFIDAGYETEGVGTVKDGVAAVGRQAFDVALIDLNLPDGTGLDLLTQLRTLRPELSVILLTAASSESAAVPSATSYSSGHHGGDRCHSQRSPFRHRRS